jgi:cell division protein FtsN
MNSMRQAQRGGTFLGFIVGVMVGLGAALAVAIYVTKVPVPFTNKNQPRSADQDAAEAKKNKDWDPNAPLYGKNPAPAATPGTGSAGGGLIPAPAPAATPGPAVAPPKAAGSSPARQDTKPAASADPLGDLAKARSSAGTADPFTYFVQAGAFRTPEDAESHRAKLSLMGVEAKVTEREQSGRTVYRVRVGPFDQKDAAEKLKERLDGSGIESALVRVQR